MDDTPMTRMDRAANSSVALIVTRFGLPALLTFIGVLLAFTLSTVKESNGEVKATLQEHGKQLTSITSDIRDINTRLDVQVINQVESTTKNMERDEANFLHMKEELEGRIEVLENRRSLK